MEGNYIYKNGSGSEGHGGICNRDNSTAAIINNVIYDNDHSGILIRDKGNPKIINNMITAHTGHNAQAPLPGAAIRVMQNEGISSVVIVNNITTHNKYGLVSQFNQPCSGNDYNDVWNNSLSNYIGFTKDLNDISRDPLFVDPENGDYHLQRGSPCIDAGTSQGAPDTDMDGNSRPKGAGYDMGAYEHAKDDGGGDDGSSSGGCFVATAAYGSGMADDVVALRELRDNILLKNSVGKSFVRFYYAVCPPLADCIEEHESLKTAVRISLMPLVAISYSILHFGPVITFTVFIVFLVVPLFLVLFYRGQARNYKVNS
jgi:parallel beta-helix repeat protein